MILAVDIGNTSITIGAYDGEKIIFRTGIPTMNTNSSEEYEDKLLDIFSLYGVCEKDFTGSVLCGVVPEVTEKFIKVLGKLIGDEPVVVGEKHNGGFKVKILPISYIGADLISDSIGAIKKYPLPCLVADLGTATKIIAIDETGVFRGCTISPGVKISLDALSDKASLLPSISLSRPERVIGENTVECMQSGIVFGTAAMLDGLIKRIKSELKNEKVTIVATGGYSKEIISCCEEKIIYDEDLLLDGLISIYNQA